MSKTIKQEAEAFDLTLTPEKRRVLEWWAAEYACSARAASSPVPSALPHTCDGGMNPPFPGECAACGRELWEATDIKALTERIAGFISAFMPQVERAESVEHRNALNGVMWDLKTAIYLLSTARNALASPAVLPRSGAQEE